MLEFLQSMNLDQQATVVGLVVSGIIYLSRHIAPSLFASVAAAAKFQRTAVAVLLAGLAILLKDLAAGTPLVAAQFIFSWALAYGTAEGAHTLVARTSANGDETREGV
jgi:hypothetical protein